jgi:hypothetical protein
MRRVRYRVLGLVEAVALAVAIAAYVAVALMLLFGVFYAR